MSRHTGKVNLKTRKGSGGFSVSLGYDFDKEQVEIHVTDGDKDFTLYPPNSQALDVFYHPYAYADRVLLAGTFAGVKS